MLHDEEDLFVLASGFESLAGENIIESIKISIYLDAQIHYPCGDEWRALNRVFTQTQSGWEKLKMFSLDINLDRYDDPPPGLEVALWRLPETQLQGLARGKDFQFDFQVPPHDPLY